MHRRGTAPLPLETTELERVSLKLAEWRRHHKAPTPLPAELWAMAVDLAGRYGIGPTARTLRLDHAALKRRASGGVIAVPAAAEFIELVAPSTGCIAECVLEVESNRGGRMRVVMKNVSAHSLACILQGFAG